MPKQTFYNLAEEKKQRLIGAIYQEFSRVPYEEVSINRIVHLAKIPRGSFYQYFEDKRDVLELLLGEYQRETWTQIEDLLKDSEGDLFEMFLVLMDYIYNSLYIRQGGYIWKQVLSDMRSNVDVMSHEFVAKLMKHIDIEKLDIRDSKDLSNMFAILIPFAGYTFAQIVLNPKSYQEDREQFAERLDLIRRGFGKKGMPCLEP